MNDRTKSILLLLIVFGVWAHFVMAIMQPVRGERLVYLDNIDGNVADVKAMANEIAENTKNYVRRSY